jgi:hypothetical protein
MRNSMAQGKLYISNWLLYLNRLHFKQNLRINVVGLFGFLGLMLLPIDSFPYFPIETSNRPIWVLPFVAIYLYQIIRSGKLRRTFIIMIGMAAYLIIKSLFLYVVYSYPSYSGLIKGSMLLVLLLPTAGGVYSYFCFLRSKYGKKYLQKLAEILVLSSLVPMFLGGLQLLKFLHLPFGGLAEPITRLLSNRYGGGARLQMSMGEPAWASTYLIFIFLFTLFHYKGKYKKLLLFSYTGFFVLTGSTLGFLYALGAVFIYLVFMLKPKYILRLALLALLALIGIIQLYSRLPLYTQIKIEMLADLVSNLSVKEVLALAAKDWSFLTRFLNPIIGFKLGVSSYGLGIGLEAFQYHIIGELKALDFTGPLSETDVRGLLGSGGTPKFLLAKIFCELGLIPFLGFCIFFARLLWVNFKRKDLQVLLWTIPVLTFNFDSYLFYVPIITFVIAYMEPSK